jgi:hypothetical protein
LPNLKLVDKANHDDFNITSTEGVKTGVVRTTRRLRISAIADGLFSLITDAVSARWQTAFQSDGGRALGCAQAKRSM